MPAEQELPEELDKLEITPLLPQAKLFDINLPVQLNPFFEKDLGDTVDQNKLKNDGTINNIQPTTSLNSHNTRIYPHNCHRCRHTSESFSDNLKRIPSIFSLKSAEFKRSTPNGVLKKTFKISSCSTAGSLVTRNFLLRQPVLKVVQTCVHSHSNVRKRLLGNNAFKIAKDGILTAQGISDFRDIANECRNVLNDVEFKGIMKQINVSTHSKNFSTIQKPKIQSSKMHNKRQMFTEETLRAPCVERIALCEHQHNLMSLWQPALFNSSLSSTSIHQRNLLSDHTSNNVRCNTTCSQQAVNSAAAVPASDDVTIDELASYFDTLVHIPKKMSSMAEMMYI